MVFIERRVVWEEQWPSTSITKRPVSLGSLHSWSRAPEVVHDCAIRRRPFALAFPIHMDANPEFVLSVVVFFRSGVDLPRISQLENRDHRADPVSVNGENTGQCDRIKESSGATIKQSEF